jgi:hypothetical protein
MASPYGGESCPVSLCVFVRRFMDLEQMQRLHLNVGHEQEWLELESFRTCWTIEFTWVTVLLNQEKLQAVTITAIAAKL